MATAFHFETEHHLSDTFGAHRIRSLSIIGGFLDGARFDFVDGLNCIIGARGAGKTTVLELMRFVLDSLPSRDISVIERRRVDSLIENNLGGGRVELTIETKDGLRYLVSRSVGEEPVVLTRERKATGITLKASGLFCADIYSQNEVESIADRSDAQLSLLDNFEADRIGELSVQIRRTQSELEANANHILPLRQRVDAVCDEIETLAAVEERLRQFVTTGIDNADQINLAHALKSQRDREQRAVVTVRQSLQLVANSVTSLRGKVDYVSKPLGDRDFVTGPNATIVANLRQQVEECGKVVDQLVEQASNHLAGIMSEIATASRALQNAHAEQEVAFRSLIEKHQHAQAQTAERVQLERRRNDLLAKKSDYRQLEEEIATLHTARSDLLVRLRRLQDERFAIRESIAQRLNTQLSPTIRVSVSQFADPQRYRRLLEDSLRSARLKHLVVAEKIANAIWPAELAAIVRSRDISSLANRAELGAEQSEKVMAAMSESSVAYRLEVVELFDLPRIELKDGDTHKDSLSLSTGQKCTTILPILLLESANPLLVDQPEDNLDNRFVFETIVESIRKVKQRRQLIFVTHNPNIPVLGDAELVFVLDSDGASSRKASEGTVDEVKSHIVTLLEGGEDAFKARKCRYEY